MPTRSLAKLLDESAELGPLKGRLGLIEALQQRYRSLAPKELAAASRVCAIEGTTVIIGANSGPVAAALRQIAPRLLAELAKRHQDGDRKSLKENEIAELTGIRIEVQVERKPPRKPLIPRGELPLDRLETLAKGLSESPLKDTLERIARDDQSRRTREKTKKRP